MKAFIFNNERVFYNVCYALTYTTCNFKAVWDNEIIVYDDRYANNLATQLDEFGVNYKVREVVEA